MSHRKDPAIEFIDSDSRKPLAQEKIAELGLDYLGGLLKTVIKRWNGFIKNRRSKISYVSVECDEGAQFLEIIIGFQGLLENIHWPLGFGFLALYEETQARSIIWERIEIDLAGIRQRIKDTRKRPKTQDEEII